MHTLFMRRTGWLVLPIVFHIFDNHVIVAGSNKAVAESIVPLLPRFLCKLACLFLYLALQSLWFYGRQLLP